MIADQITLTVDDVCKLALPLGTMSVAGVRSLARPVRWALTVSADVPLPYLEGGELLCLTPGNAEPLQIIQECANASVAALVTLTPLTPLAIAAAEGVQLPVLQLPAGTRVRNVEQAVVGLLLDRKNQTERRSMQIYQQLVQMASENVGLSQIIQQLARTLQKAIVVQDKRLQIQEYATLPELAEHWDEVTDALTNRDNLPSGLRDRHRLSRHGSPGVFQQLEINDLARLISPIVTQDIGRGYISFIAPALSFEEIDGQILDHAAVVCALEMARAKAISEIQKKLRGDFLDSLILGTVSEAEAMAEGDRMGHDMTVPHIVLVAMWGGEKHPSLRRLETVVNGLLPNYQQTILVRLRENELRIFYGCDQLNPVQAARKLAESICEEADREYPDAQIAIGIGSAASRINDWRTSYREAAQAADIVRRLQLDTAMYIGDLGIYTFLARPNYREDLRVLRDSTIGSLLKYDDNQRADLLNTLEAFFQCHGNHTQTAQVLSVHRNTLFYRMNRIAEITGLDLDQPDVRLAVHLALKIHRILMADS